MKNMLNAVHHQRFIGMFGESNETFDTQQVFAAHRCHDIQPMGERSFLQRFVQNHAMGPDAPFVATRLIMMVVDARTVLQRQIPLLFLFEP